MRKSILILAIFSLFSGALYAGDRASFDAGKSLAADGRRDFAFMAFQNFVRNNPGDHRESEAEFAIAEYYSDINNPGEVIRHLDKVQNRGDAMDILASVYRLKAADTGYDKATAAKVAEELKASLASKKMFVFFKKKRGRPWTSPLGNKYEFKESVDRMEILRNGSPFYEITLP